MEEGFDKNFKSVNPIHKQNSLNIKALMKKEKKNKNNDFNVKADIRVSEPVMIQKKDRKEDIIKKVQDDFGAIPSHKNMSVNLPAIAKTQVDDDFGIAVAQFTDFYKQ